MKYEREVLINTLENTVERQIAFAVKILQNLSEDALSKSPTTGDWSIVQILDHLNSYGAYYLPLINSKLDSSKSTEERYFKSGMFGDYFIKMIQPSTGTKNLKAAKLHLPKVDVKPMEVVMEFIRQEEVLLQYLFRARRVDLEGSRIPISIAKIIRLKLGDILLFVISHVDRHLLQVNGLLTSETKYVTKD